MALSYAQYPANGSNRGFAVPFLYINKAHVRAKVDGVPVTFTWSNDSFIQLDAAPAAGTVVEVRRTTPNDARLVDFVDGSTLTESDLDQASTQFLYLSQEAQDRADEAPRLTAQNTYDFQGRRATNLANPVAAQDAVTKAWAETDVNSSVARSRANADEAGNKAVQAGTSASQASTAAGQSATSAGQAASSATQAGTSASKAAASETAAKQAQTAAENAAANPDLSKVLTKAQNLADVADKGTARDNLGLKSAATREVGVSGGVAAFDDPRFSGTGGGGSPGDGSVTNAKLAAMPARTIKGNLATSVGPAADLPIATMAEAANGNTDTIMTATTTKKAIDAQLPVTEYVAVPPAWATYNFVKDNFNVNMGGYPKTCRAGGNQIGTTEAIAGLIDIPTSADNNAAGHGSGIAGYCRTRNTKQGAVAVYGFAFAAANNTSAWGGNTCVTNASDAVNEGANYNKDGKGSTNVNLWGWEFDFEVVKRPDGSPVGGNMIGLDLVGNGTAQPLGDVIAFRLQPHGIYASPPIPWKVGYRTEAGASLVAVSVGQLNSTGQSQSQPLEFRSRKGASEELKSSLYLDPFGALTHKPAPGGGFVAADSNGTTRLFAGDSGVTVLNSNFGVGVVGPAYPLQVRRDSASWQVAEISNLTNGAAALLQFVNSATPSGMEIGAHPSQEGFLFRVKGNARLAIDGFGHTTPGSDAQQNLGNPSFRWGTLYASTGTIQTSDGTLKVKSDGSRFVDDAGRVSIPGGEIPDAVLDAWELVAPVMFQFDDAVATKGAKARRHFGYIAQDVVARFAEKGLDAFEFGLVGADPIMADVDGVSTDTGRVRLNLRYDQCAVLEGACNRRSRVSR